MFFVSVLINFFISYFVNFYFFTLSSWIHLAKDVCLIFIIKKKKKQALKETIFSASHVLCFIDSCTLFYYSFYLLFCLCIFQIPEVNSKFVCLIGFLVAYSLKNACKTIKSSPRTVLLFFLIATFSLPFNSKFYITCFIIYL